MKDLLFTKVSERIKTIAAINLILSIIISVIGSILFLCSIEDSTPILIIIILASTIGGAAVFLISSILIYGFAEIVENAEKSIELNSLLKNNLSVLEQTSQNNKDKGNKNKVNYAINSSNNGQTGQMNYDIPEI